MSYCRMGWDGSDVYIIGTRGPEDRHVLECCGCSIALVWDDTHEWPEGSLQQRMGMQGALVPVPGKQCQFGSYQELLDHISEHRTAGHTVPDYVDERVREEMALPETDDRRWVPNFAASS